MNPCTANYSLFMYQGLSQDQTLMFLGIWIAFALLGFLVGRMSVDKSLSRLRLPTARNK